jgi:hypothetical protein
VSIRDVDFDGEELLLKVEDQLKQSFTPSQARALLQQISWKLLKDTVCTSVRLKPTLFICLNGTNDQGKTRDKIQQFMADNRHLDVKFIEAQGPGKNRALNVMVEYAKVNQFDILHFIDDDVFFKEGSLNVNVNVLIREQSQIDVPIMVGSNFIGIERDFPYFRAMKNSAMRAIKPWLLHHILITPFKLQADKPRFCIGQSLGAFVSDYPYYPDDESGMLDDGFVGNYYALKGKELFEKQGINVIFKPSNSLVYFNIPASFMEWYRQSLRNYVGIYYSYLFHPSELSFFATFFSWEYSFGKDLRRKGPYLGFKHLVCKQVYRLFQKLVLIRANKVIHAKQIPDWGTAYSTKTIS